MRAAAGSQELCARAALREPVERIAQRAIFEREASTADATIELVTKARKPGDPVIKRRPPSRRHLVPVGGRRRTPFRQPAEGLLNRAQRNAKALRHFDHGDPTENLAWKTALIPRIPQASDESLCFIEPQRRYGDAAAGGDFANA